MSTERWNDERLDRLADQVSDLLHTARQHDRLIESNARAIERHDRLIESNARILQALANALAEAGEERRQQYAIMLQHQEEIRGLQTENRRILDVLLNQQNQQNDSTDE
jgi:hypothetical protein